MAPYTVEDHMLLFTPWSEQPFLDEGNAFVKITF